MTRGRAIREVSKGCCLLGAVCDDATVESRTSRMAIPACRPLRESGGAQRANPALTYRAMNWTRLMVGPLPLALARILPLALFSHSPHRIFQRLWRRRKFRSFALQQCHAVLAPL